MRWLPVLIAIALSACTGNVKPKIEENILPAANHRDRIISLLRPTLDDPTGIRDAFITEPALRPLDKAERYVVCLRYNARGRDGKYLGSKQKAVIYYAGDVTQIIDAGNDLCGAASYRPWPELEKLCKELVCPKR